ncbi:MAG: hypothetical protein EB059_08585 [Alphaproteobacteria bacterium]|nr:hypothetical protein [Alphaproteobacteria bacterium]
MSDHNHKSVTILAFALLVFSVFQFTQILVDRDNIQKLQQDVKKNVEQADKVLAENQKMLDQLNAIAIGTQRLADAGNANAKDIVQQLTRLGIKINPNFKPGQEEKGAAATKESEAPAKEAPAK